MITPFNFAWFAFLAVDVAALVIGAILMKNKSRPFKLRLIGIIGIVNIIAFVLYRYGLFLEPDYEFIIWDELPFHLCNISVFIIPIAAFADVKWLQGYLYFLGVPGAFIGAAVSLTDFKNVPILSARGLGYYGTHFLILFLCLSFVAYGVYKPRWKHIFSVVFVAAGFAALAHGINLVFRAADLSQTANYFYTFGIEDNSLVMSIYNVIPVPLLYEVLFIPIYLALASILYLPLLITRKVKASKHVEIIPKLEREKGDQEE